MITRNTEITIQVTLSKSVKTQIQCSKYEELRNLQINIYKHSIITTEQDENPDTENPATSTTSGTAYAKIRNVSYICTMHKL
jgi:phage terminase small subunit